MSRIHKLAIARRINACNGELIPEPEAERGIEGLTRAPAPGLVRQRAWLSIHWHPPTRETDLPSARDTLSIKGRNRPVS